MTVTLDIRHREPHFAVAVHACLVIVVWDRRILPADMRLILPFERELAQRGAFAVLSVLREGVDLGVDDKVREIGRQTLVEFADTQFASALVVEGGGLRMIAIRSILTGIQLLSRSAIKQRPFADVEAAVRWLAEQPEADAALRERPDELIAAVQSLAAEF